MKPMNWIMLFMIMNLIIMFMNIKNFYFYNNNSNKKNNKYKMKKKLLMNWKW